MFRISHLRRQSARVLRGACWLLPLAAGAADLRVDVTDASAPSSVVYVALFDSAQAWTADKSVAAQILPARAGGARLSFMGLPPGTYALKVFADENGNGKLDANLLGLPTERYGFSNDARGSLGAPTFDAATVRVEADTTTTVRLR